MKIDFKLDYFYYSLFLILKSNYEFLFIKIISSFCKNKIKNFLNEYFLSFKFKIKEK